MDNGTSTPTHDYDIAVSFAGEDRKLVEALVRRLQSQNVTVFYDEDHLAAIWGENLVDFLEAVYARKARYAILFVSRHYAAKKWPNHERQSAQDRALQQSAPYILPVRLDDTELPGLHSSVGYLDARELGIDRIASAILDKLGHTRAATPERTFDGKVPRTPEAIAELLRCRPAAWEYLLFAAVLRQELAAREGQYHDHIVGYARSTGVNLTDNEAATILSRELGALHVAIDSFNRVLDPAVQEQAFGRPGEPGDPDRVIHLGKRFASVYGDFMTWAANLRGAGISNEHLRRAAQIESRFVDQSLLEMRSFVETFVAEADTLVERLAKCKPVGLEVTVTLRIGDDLVRQLQEALAAYAE